LVQVPGKLVGKSQIIRVRSLIRAKISKRKSEKIGPKNIHEVH